MATATRIKHMTLDDLRQRGDLDDCVAGPPPWSVSDGWRIDEAIAATSVCASCDVQGLTYRPYHSRKGRVYVAVLVCPACGQADLL